MPPLDIPRARQTANDIPGLPSELLAQACDELEWAIAEISYIGDRGDHLVYRDEWEAFERWQRRGDVLVQGADEWARTDPGDLPDPMPPDPVAYLASRVPSMPTFRALEQRVVTLEARLARLEMPIVGTP